MYTVPWSSAPYIRMDTLAGLPTDLLFSIMHFLPPADLMCLSLCNHRLYEALKGETRRRGCTRRYHTFLILTRLERDHPRYFACDKCLILHEYDGTESFGIGGLNACTPRLPCDWRFHGLSGLALMGSHNSLTYPRSLVGILHVKLAMKRFQYGPGHGINTESLRWAQVRHYDPNSLYAAGLTCLFSREAQICPNHLDLGLSLRMQDIILVNNRSDLIPTPAKVLQSLHKNEPPWIVDICSHLRVDHLYLNVKVLELFDAKAGKKTDFPCKCEICNTDAHLEVKPLDSKSALVITRWVSLGSGLSRYDPLWISQAYSRGVLDKFNTEGYESPRMCFEELAPESFQEVTSRNLSYLENHRYRKDARFTASEDGFWYTPYKDPGKPAIEGL